MFLIYDYESTKNLDYLDTLLVCSLKDRHFLSDKFTIAVILFEKIFFSLQTLIMGNRDDIDEMSSGNATVLTMVLKLIDKYDLYGLVAYPKHHKQSDVPDIYRLAAKTKVPFGFNAVHILVSTV